MFFYISWFLWILLGRSALIEFGHRSRVIECAENYARALWNKQGTSKRQGWVWNGKQMLQKRPFSHAPIWRLSKVLTVSRQHLGTNQCEVIRHIYQGSGCLRRSADRQKRAERDGEKQKETTANTKQHLMSGYRPDLLAPPPPTSWLAWIQTDSSPHYKQKAHLLPTTKGNPSDIQEDLRDFVFLLPQHDKSCTKY